MLVVLTRWIECQKKVATTLVFGKIKYATCYLRHVSNVLLRKWFLLSRASSPCLAAQDEPMLPTGWKQVILKLGILLKPITKE
jgi:hypothetical protein